MTEVKTVYYLTITGPKTPDASDLVDILQSHKWPDGTEISAEVASSEDLP